MSDTSVEQQLALLFEPIISPRRPFEALWRPISKLKNKDQVFALHLGKVIARSNVELAYSFACDVTEALKQIQQDGTRAWALSALDVYDQEGLYPAIKQLQALTQFSQLYRQQQSAVSFTQVQQHLELFLQGLSGRALSLAVAEKAYTDTESIFLPQQICRFKQRESNRRLYKAQAVFLWAQTRYGTFKRANSHTPALWDRLNDYIKPEQAELQFLFLESIRLMSKMQVELPGLAREMHQLCPISIPMDASWSVFKHRLQAPEAHVETTFEVLDELIRLQLALPNAYLFQGGFALSETQAIMTARHQRELSELFTQESDADQDSASAEHNESTEIQPTSEKNGPQPDAQLSSQQQSLIDSLLQDFDHLPSLSDFEGHDSPQDQHTSTTPENLDTNLGEATYFDEWDCVRQSYRQDWCRVFERLIPVTDQPYRKRVINKHPHLVKSIHRIFEGIRDAPVLLKKQRDGEEIDIDAVIGAAVDRLTGQEPSDRLYLRKNHHERSISVLILVDVSGSTKGWINEAERESLILICEALERLDDRYAIYAFSGMTHERCEIFPIKGFSQQYDTEVQARIGGLVPRYYTRMGPAIRFASKAISQEIAKHRLMLVLSDGKPDDYDGYKGEYGIEDTRKAIIEARAIGIKPFCITIDSEAPTYLPHIFGARGFTLLDDVGKLPLKIADIYHRLSAGA